MRAAFGPLFVSNPRWCCAIPASASRVEPIEVAALDPVES
jgi:hypothetical protein